jgi:hypothetical protein
MIAHRGFSASGAVVLEASPSTEAGDRLVVAIATLATPDADHGWTVRATTVGAAGWTETALLQASQEQPTTVAPGCRGRKPPAARAPVWREQPARRAAGAMLPVVGLLVSRGRQRQGRLSLRPHDQQLPGNNGMTASPTAAVVLALVAHVALVPLRLEEPEGPQLAGIPPHHRWVCEALGLDSSCSAVPVSQKNGRHIQTP